MNETEQRIEDNDDEAQRTERDEELLSRLITILGEHFDSVQIFATRQKVDEPNTTCYRNVGTGNYFARRGMIEDWLVAERAKTAKEATSDE